MTQPHFIVTDRIGDATSSAGVVIRQGAKDQAAAYAALLAQWADVEPENDAREWQRVQAKLQETRRATGQRLLFPE